MSNNLEYKVILVGNFGVGKTSIIRRFIDNTFQKERLPETFDTMTKIINEADGKTTTLKITDTAGGEKFRTLTSSFYRNADAIVITYDLTSQESFDDLDGAHKEADYYAAPACKFICGNKSDLPRTISQAQAKEMATREGLPYFEVSALNGDGVHDLFNAVVKKLSHTGPSGVKPADVVDIGKKPKKPGDKDKGGCTLF